MNITDKFEQIVMSLRNGQKKQAKEQLKKLNVEQKVLFFNYIWASPYVEINEMRYLTEAMIRRKYN